MSPKSEPPARDHPTKLINNHEDKEHERVREDIFSRMDNPLWLDQQIYNIAWLSISHVFTIYYFYLYFTNHIPNHFYTWYFIFQLLYAWFGGLGITVGCHRYWTHKTFKAKLPLQILLMVMQSSAVQYPIHKWCLDHRIHHKYVDTDADPHNSKRGFWFSHMGWLVLPKHPELKKKLKTFDMSDLENDPVVRFQARYHWTFTVILFHILPNLVYYYVWNMPKMHCLACNFARYVISLHGTWCVNSVAHILGDKPYDKGISAADNAFVSLYAAGEGWHNYHHTFPWDYKAAELGWKFNLSTMFIDFFAWIGWAYDLKTVSQKMLIDRCKRTGDGSHVDFIEPSKECPDEKSKDFEYNVPDGVTQVMEAIDEGFWGWDDGSIPDEFRKATKILQPEKYE